MEAEDIKSLYEEKYQDVLGMTYEEWQENGPKSEAEAYARLQEIDEELRNGYEEWFEGEGEEKEQLGEYRDKLKSEYDLLEAAFCLEAPDKNW